MIVATHLDFFCVLLTSFNEIIFLVPTSAPDEITGTEITSTTILLDWREIFLPERHGIIKGYKLTYQKSNGRNKRDTELETRSFDANIFTAFLFELTPYTNYTITLAGLTSKGLGVENVMRIETAEGSKKFLNDLTWLKFPSPMKLASIPPPPIPPPPVRSYCSE